MIWILLILFVLCGYGYYDLRKRISNTDTNLIKVDDRLNSSNEAANLNFKTLHNDLKYVRRQGENVSSTVLKMKKDIKEIQSELT